jgi:ribosomal-protein-alanine N-acetyltransferase
LLGGEGNALDRVVSETPSVFQAPATIETDRLVIRGIQEADMADLLVMNQDDEVLRFLPYAKWLTLDDGLAWLARVRKLEAAGTAVQLVMVDKASARVIGACVLFKYDEGSSRAELGFAMAREFWGKGLMLEALTVLIAHAFTVRGVRRLEAEANSLNTASCRLLDRLGFVSEGLMRQRYRVKGAIYDTRVFGLLGDEWKAPAPRVP